MNQGHPSHLLMRRSGEGDLPRQRPSKQANKTNPLPSTRAGDNTLGPDKNGNCTNQTMEAVLPKEKPAD